MIEAFPKMLSKKFAIVSEGLISYDYKTRTNCLLRIKRKLLDEFPDLAKTHNKVNYRMELWNTHEELKKRVAEIEENKRGIPILLTFYLDNESEPNN